MQNFNFEKNELIQYANDNGLFIRKSVTKGLGLLVCGKTAGWKKLETANKLEVVVSYALINRENENG